jgi:2-dehydro-3-deoxy-L-rhamnonate dehydrogenase (NAD+)
MNALDFKGRTAVVTGGAAGIGQGVAKRLLASGATVALWDRDKAALTTARSELGSERVHVVPVDVSSEASVGEACTRTMGLLGRIDVLVCSAGITGPNALLVDYPADAWKAVFDVNVHGLFFCNKAVVPAMKAGGYGRIVNIASVAGKEGNPNASAYSASKAAVIAITKSLGKELATTPIRVNCVTPAAVRTGMFSQMTQQHIDFMLSKIPMGRFGTVEDIASLVCWLASEDCSFSTGAVFDASGGRATY